MLRTVCAVAIGFAFALIHACSDEHDGSGSADGSAGTNNQADGADVSSDLGSAPDHSGEGPLDAPFGDVVLSDACGDPQPICVAECGSSLVDQICVKFFPVDQGIEAQLICPPSHPKTIGVDCPKCDYCADGEFCDSQYNKCDGWGECVPKSYCGAGTRPVCGCNGKSYPNQCAAAELGGVDIGQANCAAPSPDWFACGPWFCLRYAEYCEVLYGDQNDLYPSCRALPSGCAAASCGCLATEPCSNTSFNPGGCSEADGAVTRSCYF